MKTAICVAVGGIGALVAQLVGNWSISMVILIVMMALDYVTGLVVAGVFHKSPKSESGKVESRAGWKGLCRKFGTLGIVLLAHIVDVALGFHFLRETAIIFYISNEAISLIENVALMGVPIPKVLTKALEVLNKKGGEADGKDGEGSKDGDMK